MDRSDPELIEASRRGEHVAFGALVERHQRAVLAVSYSGTRDRALGEDVAQDTFVTAWRELDRLRDVSRFRPWLCGIARNLARKARLRREREVPVDEIVGERTPHDAVEEREVEVVVVTALDRVDDTYREALVLYYYEQQSIDEVAAALGVSGQAAYQRLARGRQQLADGVAHLVERSLGRRKPKRNLVAVVLAAIAVTPGSHAEAATKGADMKGIAIVVSAVMAVGTGGYLVRQSVADSRHTTRHDVNAGTTQASSEHRTLTSVADPILAGSTARFQPRRSAVTAGIMPVDCATAIRHVGEVTSQEITKIASAGEREQTLDLIMAKVNAKLEAQCAAENWPQEVLACFVQARDNEEIGDCQQILTPLPSRPMPASATVDASCAAVATHISELSPPAQKLKTEQYPLEKREAVHRLVKEVAAGLEKDCVDEGWPDEVRRCHLGAITLSESRACR